jgi:hypothetical protein
MEIPQDVYKEAAIEQAISFLEQEGYVVIRKRS